MTTRRSELETVTPTGEPSQRCIAGRYEVKGSLGRGASKEVFLARDIRLGRDVALALVISSRKPGLLPARLRQEIRTAALLGDHPHIVTVYDVIDQEGATWIVSRLVRGGSVAEHLHANPGGLPILEAMRIAREVADALHFAHEHGVVHRDVKPSNVLLAGPQSAALLTDFGVALISDQPRLTVNAAPVGTAAYMAPEQALGDSVDRRADLYSLGVMLFELVCGHRPFAGATIAALVTKHLYEQAPDPCTLNPAAPPALGQLVLQLMRKHPDDRPRSALDVCEALDALKAPRAVPERAAALPDQRSPIPALADSAELFVGRRSFMAGLRDAWERAAHGRPEVALVTGEAGIGKTTLALAFARSVHKEGAVVLYGRCDEDPLVSYQPLIEALRQLIVARPEAIAALDARWTAELRELAKLIPELRRHPLARQGAESEDRGLERYQLFETVLALLSPIAERQRMLLVLDDMQWADEPTGLLLRHLIRASVPGLMVLITRRPPKPDERSPLTKLAGDLARHAGGRERLVRLSIGGLDAQETFELASARRDQPVAREFSQLLRANTAGNPFFIEQVLRGLRDADLSDSELAAAALRSLRVPEEVQEFIEGRVAGFGSDVAEVLKQAAVCGPEFNLDVLAELRHAHAEAVVDLLREPVAAGLVLEPGVGRYAFCHALVRETLYECGLGKSERARLHLRIGEAIERLAPERVSASQLALHFYAAREVGGAERAVKYALVAAESASGALAYEEAAAYARDARDALELLGPAHDVERCRVLRYVGRLRWQSGDQQGAQAEFLRSATLARQLGDATELARAVLGYAGRSYAAEAIDPVLRELFTEALATVPDSETSLRAKLLARLAEALYPVDGERALELTEAALQTLAQAPDDQALASVVAARHFALLHVDHHEERLEVGERWVALAEALRRESVGMALNWRVYDLIERGEPRDIKAAQDVRELLHKLAEKLQQPLFWHFAACLDAKWLLMEGRFAEAEEKAREGYVHGTRAQGSHVALLLGGQRFSLRRDQGRLRELPQEVAPYMDPENETLPAWRAGLILARCEGGELGWARSELRAMIAEDFAAVPRDMFWLGAMCLLAECAADLADTDAAAMLIARLRPYARYNAQIGLSFVLGPVHGFLARLAALLGDLPAAERHFELALERTGILGALPAEARNQCHFAEAVLWAQAEPGRQRAGDLLERSQSTARRLGMTGIDYRAGAAAQRSRSLPTLRDHDGQAPPHQR